MRKLLLAAELGLLLAARLAVAAGPQGRWPFRVYAGGDGLTDANPYVLLRDRAGLLWTGTPNGLFRFDGRTFTRFAEEDGLPASAITALAQRPDGRLYAGTRTGLARWDGAVFVPAGAGLPPGPITALEAGTDGTLYAATPKGLFLTVEEQFGQDKGEAGEPTAVTALAVADGSLFFARDGKLWKREAGRALEFGAAKGLAGAARIDALHVDGAGALWVRGVGRLDVLPAGGDRFLSRSEVLPAGTGSGPLAGGDEGGVLVPTTKGLVSVTSAGSRVLGRSSGLPGDVVLAAFVDREGILWAGLAGEGLARRMGGPEVTGLTPEDGLPAGGVRAVARARDGALLLGTLDGLVRVSESGVVTRLTGGDGLGGSAVLALATGPDRAVWAGSYPGGVTRLADGKPVRFAAEGVDAASFLVLSLLAARDGTVWAGARGGAYRLAPGARTFTPVPTPDGEEIGAVSSLAEDETGAVWAATRSGLLRLAPSSKRFRKRNGLSQDAVAAVSRAHMEGLAVAYRDGGVDLVTPQGEGLLVAPLVAQDAAHVAALARDSKGALWAGGGGLRVFSAGGADAVVRLGREDGILSDDVSPNAIFADADGQVLVGTVRGLVLRRPAAPRIRAAPRVAFTSVTAGARRLKPGREAVLRPEETPLAIRWAPLTLAGGSPRFRWTLDGVGSETAGTEALFASLPPGAHVFEVGAAGAPASQGGAGAGERFAFSVESPWWKSLPARLGQIALAVAAFLGLVSLRTRAVRLERDRLRQSVHEKVLRIESLRRDLSEAGLTDADLGVRNARFFLETVPSDFEKSCRAYSRSATPVERRNADLLVYLVEADGVRVVLAREGRPAVEALLKELVSRLRAVVRSSDFLVRWTDTAFLVVSRGGARDSGGILAGKILALVGDTPVQLPSGPLTFTVSVGWVPLPWLTGSPATVTLDDALRLATRALAAAKEAGGDTAIGVFAPGDGEEFAGEAQIPSEGSLLAVDGRSVRLELTQRS